MYLKFPIWVSNRLFWRIGAKDTEENTDTEEKFVKIVRDADISM